jgi:hypothetical protein
MSEDIRDPFAVEDEYDPFATADEATSGGSFVPWPKVEDVAERLIVLVPRKHDKDAEVSEYLQREHHLAKTREEWRADLVVLDGETPFSYEYRAKKEGTDNEFVTATHTFDALPALIPDWRITWGNILGVLNKIGDSPKPFALGRIRGGYGVKEMRAGRTFEQHAAEQAAWLKNPKGQRPKTVWHLVVSDDPADRAVALAWWKQAHADGFKI